MVVSKLNRLQQLLIDAFFEQDSDFYLTGGAALAGYHPGHRTTDDLDLFATHASMDEGVRALRASVACIGGEPSRAF